MSSEKQKLELEERKVKALEKIGTCLDALTLWFEEIDKDEWSERVAWYLHLWKEKYIGSDEEINEE
jgi:hypothetical protein